VYLNYITIMKSILTAFVLLQAIYVVFAQESELFYVLFVRGMTENRRTRVWVKCVWCV